MKIILVMLKLWGYFTVPLAFGIIFGISTCYSDGSIMFGTFLGSITSAIITLIVVYDNIGDFEKAEEEVLVSMNRRVARDEVSKTLGSESLIVRLAYGRPWAFVFHEDTYYYLRKQSIKCTEQTIAVPVICLRVIWGIIVWALQLAFTLIVAIVCLIPTVLLLIVVSQIIMYRGDFPPTKNNGIRLSERVIQCPKISGRRFRLWECRWNRELIINYIRKNKHRMYVNVKL